jgi:hypothetical protein
MHVLIDQPRHREAPLEIDNFGRGPFVGRGILGRADKADLAILDRNGFRPGMRRI